MRNEERLAFSPRVGLLHRRYLAVCEAKRAMEELLGRISGYDSGPDAVSAHAVAAATAAYRETTRRYNEALLRCPDSGR